MNRSPHHTKKGPGRRHVEGKPGRAKRRGRGFKGASFSIPREAFKSSLVAAGFSLKTAASLDRIEA